MWVVRIALSRPYTFIVLAILILVLSPVVILRTPTDIFPNIDIPVVAVAWQFTGMNPEELEGRLTSTYYGRQYRTHRIDYRKWSSHSQDLLSTRRESGYSKCAGDGDIPDHPSPTATRHAASPNHQF